MSILTSLHNYFFIQIKIVLSFLNSHVHISKKYITFLVLSANSSFYRLSLLCHRNRHVIKKHMTILHQIHFDNLSIRANITYIQPYIFSANRHISTEPYTGTTSYHFDKKTLYLYHILNLKSSNWF